MITDDVKAMIPMYEEVAKAHGLDPNLVLAIATHETNGKRFKARIEPTWPDSQLVFARTWAEKLLISFETECTLQRMSWGPMQVMGAVARQHGFQGDIPELTDATLGIEYGCKHLVWTRTYKGCETEEDLISAYNQGSPRKTPGGMYVNQVGYVDPVCAILRDLRKLA